MKLCNPRVGGEGQEDLCLERQLIRCGAMRRILKRVGRSGFCVARDHWLHTAKAVLRHRRQIVADRVVLAVPDRP